MPRSQCCSNLGESSAFSTKCSGKRLIRNARDTIGNCDIGHSDTVVESILSPMFVTLFGMAMLPSFKQLQNVYTPMLVMVLGRVMLVRFERLKKIPSPRCDAHCREL